MKQTNFLFSLSTLRLFMGLCCLLFFFSCDSRKAAAPSTAEFHTVTDDLGRKVELPVEPRRIMALAPSMTEMLFAVADTATIVGRTQNCDYPAAALTKPVVNNYPMDYEKLLSLKPDVVFATEGIISMEVAAQVQKMGIPIYFQAYDSVTDILRGIRNLGFLLNRREKGQAVADSLQAWLNQLAADSARGTRPRVLAITWKDPIYVYGRNTLFTDKLRYAGGQNAVTEVFAQPYPALTREYILKMNPDLIIGGSFDQMEKTFFSLYPELRRIKAYQQKRIFDVTDDLMSRPSPRVVEGIAELKAVLQ
ncbi:ABC transporter substrate-binding protein [Rufibacter roseolus]|uniref:ABC transporter substrate-binding protein n=1 Tax=Rufibacter roseolus TaxID=2817375 RepID=UPI00293D453A|nr:helical backbone metal receptor [Rufibacter roseolus]